MAFKQPKGEVTLPVSAEFLKDGGKKERVRFNVTYRIISSHTKKQQMLQQIRDDAVDDEAIVDEYVLGWANLRGDDNELIEYNEENVQQALDLTEYRSALVNGFLRANFNLDEVAAKN